MKDSEPVQRTPGPATYAAANGVARVFKIWSVVREIGLLSARAAGRFLRVFL